MHTDKSRFQKNVLKNDERSSKLRKNKFETMLFDNALAKFYLNMITKMILPIKKA